MGQGYYIDVLIGLWEKESIDIQDQKYISKQKTKSIKEF